MKKLYQSPEIRFEDLSKADIICASNGFKNGLDNQNTEYTLYNTIADFFWERINLFSTIKLTDDFCYTKSEPPETGGSDFLFSNILYRF